MTQPALGLLLALLFPFATLRPLAQEGPTPTVISGRLFVDLNADGAYQEGEPALGGIAIEFANGERIETVYTAADGSFTVQVEPGLWRTTLRPPEGFEYALPQGIELQVVESGEPALDLQIGLQPVQLLQVLVNALESEVDPVETGGEVEQPAGEQSPETTDPGIDPEIYDGPFVPVDGNGDPILLPESGSSLPPRVALVAAAGGLLAIGLVIWAAGRELESRQQRGGPLGAVPSVTVQNMAEDVADRSAGERSHA